MIDSNEFAKQLIDLATFYKREMPSSIRAIWYKKLKDRMSTEEFISAVEEYVFRNSAFMPSPEELLNLVKGSQEALALVEWDKCLAAASRAKREHELDLSPQGKFALKAIGGLVRLAMSEEDENHWIRKEFVSVWKSYPATGNLPQLPAATSAQLEIEASPPPPEFVEAIKALSRNKSINGNGKT